MKILHLEIKVCSDCPYCKEGSYKGLVTGNFYCSETSNLIGSEYNSYTSIPSWCPLLSHLDGDDEQEIPLAQREAEIRLVDKLLSYKDEVN